MNTYFERVADMVRDHGFAAHVTEAGVKMFIPTDKGESVRVVEDHDEALQAMGRA